MPSSQEVRSIQAARGLTPSLFAWILLALVIAAGVGAYLLRPATSAASYDYQGTAVNEPAPDFQLVDQHGARVALADFAGQVVVLTFLDSHCADVCPLTALQLRRASQTLGADAPVVFLGVNINSHANSVDNVLASTHNWRLDELPVWHFLTGERQELAPVWKAYSVGVQAAAEGGLMHATGVYVIDHRGQKRWYVSIPVEETGTSPGFTPLSDLLVQHIRTLLQEEQG